MEVKIKSQFATQKIAFGSSGKPLGERSQEELQDLAILGQQSGDQSILNMFESLPDLTELQKAKTERNTAGLKKPAKPEVKSTKSEPSKPII